MKSFLSTPAAFGSLTLTGKLFGINNLNHQHIAQCKEQIGNIVFAGTEPLLIVLLALGVISSLMLPFFYKKRNISPKKLADFKYNVSLLRAEKLGSYNNIKLQNRRKKILNKVEPEQENLNSLFSKKAKKLGIGTGEFLLAAKIQSSVKRS